MSWTPELRDALGELLEGLVGDDLLTVLPRGPRGPFQPPVAVMGMPDVEWGDYLCTDLVRLDVTVVVRDHPDGPAASIAELEGLWPQVAGRLRAHIDRDPTLGGLVTSVRMARADFGDYAVQGKAYAAQNITLEFHV